MVIIDVTSKSHEQRLITTYTYTHKCNFLIPVCNFCSYSHTLTKFKESGTLDRYFLSDFYPMHLQGMMMTTLPNIVTILKMVNK